MSLSNVADTVTEISSSLQDINLKPQPSLEFQTKGTTEDEIALVFREEKELYMSRNVLFRASPVFKAMFEHDCKEKQEGRVNLDGDDFCEFNEFLKCIDPGTLQDITRDNVLKVVALADKYQHESLIRKCKKVMLSWLELCKTKPLSLDVSVQGQFTLSALQILKKSVEIGYDDVRDKAADVVGRFSSRIYTIQSKADNQFTVSVAQTGTGFGSSGFVATTGIFGQESTVTTTALFGQGSTAKVKRAPANILPHSECQQLFVDLSAEVQNDVLRRRLIHVENYDFISN